MLTWWPTSMAKCVLCTVGVTAIAFLAACSDHIDTTEEESLPLLANLVLDLSWEEDRQQPFAIVASFTRRRSYLAARQDAQWAVIKMLDCNWQQGESNLSKVVVSTADGSGHSVSTIDFAGFPQSLEYDPVSRQPFVAYGVGDPLCWWVSATPTMVAHQELAEGGATTTFSLPVPMRVHAMLPFDMDGGVLLGHLWAPGGESREPPWGLAATTGFNMLVGYGSQEGLAVPVDDAHGTGWGCALPRGASDLQRWGDGYLAVVDCVRIDPSGEAAGRATLLARFSQDFERQALTYVEGPASIEKVTDVTALDADHLVMVRWLRDSDKGRYFHSFLYFDKSLALIREDQIDFPFEHPHSYHPALPLMASCQNGYSVSVAPSYFTSAALPWGLDLSASGSDATTPWRRRSVVDGSNVNQFALVNGGRGIDSACRPIFAVDDGDSTRILLTDRWGRLSIPDPDPCGGDGPDACDDGDACTVDGCNEQGCVHQPDVLRWECLVGSTGAP